MNLAQHEAIKSLLDQIETCRIKYEPKRKPLLNFDEWEYDGKEAEKGEMYVKLVKKEYCYFRIVKQHYENLELFKTHPKHDEIWGMLSDIEENRQLWEPCRQKIRIYEEWLEYEKEKLKDMDVEEKEEKYYRLVTYEFIYFCKVQEHYLNLARMG